MMYSQSKLSKVNVGSDLGLQETRAKLKMLSIQHSLILRSDVCGYFLLLTTEISSLKPEERHQSQLTGEYC